jgi:hypothetical protein
MSPAMISASLSREAAWRGVTPWVQRRGQNYMRPATWPPTCTPLLSPHPLQCLVSPRLRLRHGLQMPANPFSEDFAA